MKPPFSYFGSKANLSKSFLEIMPVHNCWVEVFCGSAALTFAKKPAQIEILNDINGEIVNVFKQLRDNSDELIELIELTPYSEEELSLCRIDDDLDGDLERARKFLVKAMFAINGTFGTEKGGFSLSKSYSRAGVDARVSRWLNMPEKLVKVAHRLKQVAIISKDAIKVVDEYSNRPATLLYLDPPYLANRSKSYDHDEMGEEFHKKLLEKCVNSSNTMQMISAYESDLYNDILVADNNWTLREFKAQVVDIGGKRIPRVEAVYTNPLYEETLDNGQLQLDLTEKELKDKKVNPIRK